MTNQTSKKSWIPDIIKDQFFHFIVLLGLFPAITFLLFYGLFGFPIALKSSNQREEIGLFSFFIILVIALIAAVVLLYKKQWKRILWLAPALYPILILLGANYGFDDVDTEGNPTFLLYGYFIASQIAFFYFIVRGKIRSWPFFTLLGLIFFFSGLLESLLFILYTGLFKLLYLAYQQNIDIFKKMGWKESLKTAGRAFLYWSPLLVFIIPGAIFSDKMYKKAMDAFYTNSFVVPSNEEKKYEILQFEKDLQSAMDNQLKTARDRMLKERKKIIGQFHKTKKAPKELAKRLGNTIPDDLTKISSAFKLEKCGFLNIKCGIKNMTKNAVNESYQDQRMALIDDFEKEGSEMVKKHSGDAQRQIQEVFNRTDRLLVSINKGAQQSLSFAFWSILLIQLISDILLWFIIIKSFMYVFARVAFTDDTDNYVTFMEDETAMPKGSIQKYGNQYTIPPTVTTNFFVSRTYEPSGKAPKFVIPQKSKALMARLFTRNYSMNKITMDRKPSAVDFKSISSQEFIEWNIKEGEEVIFHFTNFVGMSEGVQLSAIISLRLTSLLMGRIIFTTAKGPGKLILSTLGQPAVTGDKKANASVPTSRIIAWDKNARFHVESELNLTDVFMSGIYLKKKEEDVVLIDADVRGHAKSGIVQFIRHFILPV